MVLNYIWIGFFLIGFVVAMFKLLMGGHDDIFTVLLHSFFDAAKTGFEISIGLTGMMALWLGIMRIGEGAGMIQNFSKGVAPLFSKIFKGVPKGHPAHGSIAMNFSANMLGLDNAATPMGLKAMADLQSLNPHPEKATDAQIMFLVLNTAGMTIIPTSIIAIRQTIALQQGLIGFNAADIFLPILIATFLSFVLALIITCIAQGISLWSKTILLFIVGFISVLGLLIWGLNGLPEEVMQARIGQIGGITIFTIIISFILLGVIKKVNVYELFIEGAKDGFKVAIGIIPYLIAMLVAISIFRASGSMDFILSILVSFFQMLGWNTDFVPALPIAMMKPLSGSGARGLMVDVMNEYGVDSFQGKLAAIIQGSTETTFYVLAVYFGSVKIIHTRNAVILGLIADFVAVVIAVLVAYWFFY